MGATGFEADESSDAGDAPAPRHPPAVHERDDEQDGVGDPDTPRRTRSVCPLAP